MKVTHVILTMALYIYTIWSVIWIVKPIILVKPCGFQNGQLLCEEREKDNIKGTLRKCGYPDL